MNIKFRSIEIDAETASALEERAAARGISVSEFLSEMMQAESAPSALDGLREAGRGPWAPEILAEDARRLSDFESTGEGVPWEEVASWMRSWGTPNELPPPKPRKL
jgi:predicted transcriptional regulator